jgi:hypothetical protein
MKPSVQLIYANKNGKKRKEKKGKTKELRAEEGQIPHPQD